MREGQKKQIYPCFFKEKVARFVWSQRSLTKVKPKQHFMKEMLKYCLYLGSFPPRTYGVNASVIGGCLPRPGPLSKQVEEMENQVSGLAQRCWNKGVKSSYRHGRQQTVQANSPLNFSQTKRFKPDPLLPLGMGRCIAASQWCNA